MSTLKCLVKYIVIYIIFYLIVSVFIGGTLKNTLLPIITAMFILIFVCAILQNLLGDNNNTLFNKLISWCTNKLWKIILVSTGILALVNSIFNIPV